MYDLDPNRKTAAQNNGLLLIRLAVGLMILMAGLQKAFNPDQLAVLTETMLSINLPENAVYIVFLFEIIAPLMLILGVLSRMAAGFIVVYVLIGIFTASVDSLMVMDKYKGHALESEFMFILIGFAIICLGSGDKAMYPD